MLYGFAKLGKRLFDFLNRMSVDISAIAVDRPYMPPALEHLEKPIVVIDDLIESGDTFNYIIGFNPRNQGEQIRERLVPSARHILMYDFGYGVCEDIHNSIAYYSACSSCYKQHMDEVYGWLEDDRSQETLHPDYRLYIRGHSTLVTNELVLYAV